MLGSKGQGHEAQKIVFVSTVCQCNVDIISLGVWSIDNITYLRLNIGRGNSDVLMQQERIIT